MSWNPAQYLKFQAARLRPAIDLLNRAALTVPDKLAVRRVLDLGCGPGNITPFLAQEFPNAVIDGVDSSDKMIEKASSFKDSINDSTLRDRLNFRVNTIENEVATSQTKYDLVYANASLHWCVKHEELFPRIVQRLLYDNNGVLAVQMPDTRTQPSHLLMETAALRSGLIDKLQNVRIPRTERDPQWYFDVLSSEVRDIDMWSTEYVEQLTTLNTNTSSSSNNNNNNESINRHPVHEFTRGTGLLPVLQAIGGEHSEQGQMYITEYDRLLCEAYPSTVVKNKFHLQGKTVTLFPFKRFFLVCKT